MRKQSENARLIEKSEKKTERYAAPKLTIFGTMTQLVRGVGTSGPDSSSQEERDFD